MISIPFQPPHQNEQALTCLAVEIINQPNNKLIIKATEIKTTRNNFGSFIKRTAIVQKLISIRFAITLIFITITQSLNILEFSEKWLL